MSRQISTENWLRRITHPRKPFSQLLRESVDDPGRWISLSEAANRLGMSESGAWKAAMRYGWLENHKVGRRRLVTIESVERFRKFRESRKSRPPGRKKRRIPDDGRSTIDDVGAQPSVSPKSEIENRKSEIAPSSIVHRQSSLQPDGHLWRDPANDDIWVPVDRAENVLLIGKDQIGQLALQGKIRRKWQHKTTGEEVHESQIQFRHRPKPHIENWKLEIGNRKLEIDSSIPASDFRLPSSEIVWSGRVRAMYSMRDLLALAEKRNNRGRNRSFPVNDPERPIKHVRILTELKAPPNDALLTRNEAAHFLGVVPSRITALVLAGTLFAWQKEPGKPGCPLYLSANQVTRLGNKWDHVKCRASYMKGKSGKKKDWKPNSFQEDRHLWDPPQKAAKRDHGEFYTTLQAAQVLGLTRDTVLAMRRNGRLQGYRSPDSTNFKQTFNRRRWWFFKKLDVHDLKADRERKKRSKAYWKARNPLLYSDDVVDGPTIQWPDAEYRPHEWNPKQPTDNNPFEELREGMRKW